MRDAFAWREEGAVHLVGTWVGAAGVMSAAAQVAALRGGVRIADGIVPADGAG